MNRRVAVSGASGLIGSALCSELRKRGDTVLRLVRAPARTDDEVLDELADGARAWIDITGATTPDTPSPKTTRRGTAT